MLEIDSSARLGHAPRVEPQGEAPTRVVARGAKGRVAAAHRQTRRGLGQAAVFSLAAVATITKKDFSFMGRFLFIGMIVILLAIVANIFLEIPALSLTISAVAVLVFSAYILYDISRIVNGGETNYISATLSVYLSIYNVFVSLLNLLMMLSGERD